MSIEVFAKFSDSSRRVLLAAQKIAQENNMGINSEHLLIALATVQDTYAYKLLHQFTINVDQIRLILRLRGPESNLKSGLSSYVRKILELATAQAVNFGNSRVDAEHLLLAITSLEDCLAYQIIARIGINPAQIKTNLVQLFTEIARMDELIDQHTHQGPGVDRLVAPDHIHDDSNQKRSKTPALDYFGTNMTQQASAGKFDPVIGRDREINRLIQILARKTKNNPVLIGDPGVGKTAIVEGLALKISNDDIPEILKNKQLVSLDLALVVAGTMYRGQFEERLKKILFELKTNPEIILFIDELHTIVGSGNTEGSQDTANILKPALAKGEIRLIGATTADEYRKFIERDAALERRLQIISVEEPTVEQTTQILQGIKATYEAYHQVTIDDQAIDLSVKLANQYIHNRFFPDKAIDILDEASAMAKLSGAVSQPISPEMSTLKQHLILTTHEKEKALANNNFELAQEYQNKELIIQNKIQSLTSQQTNQPKPIVNKETIARVVSQWANIPVTQLTASDANRLINLEQELSRQIIGQDSIIKTIAAVLRRAKTRISDPSKPMGSFLFLGPSGVGKTELAKVLAKSVFGKEQALVKIDMSEFMERHAVSRLLGAPAGYIGYDDAGKFTELIRKNPYCVVLFDEIEKAHPEVLNILLQIFEDGYATDAKGRQISFRNSIVILTSNIGLHEFTTQAEIGFKAVNAAEKERFLTQFDELKKKLLKKLKETFKPELLNRIDYFGIFNPLDKQSIREITKLQLSQLKSRLVSEGYIISFAPKVIDYITASGFDPQYGARPIRRRIAQLVEESIALNILKGEIEKGISYKATIGKKNQLIIRHSLKPIHCLKESLAKI